MNHTTLTECKPTSSSTLPSIQANGRKLRDITKDALSALEEANKPPLFFVRAGEIVRFRTDELDRPILETVSETMLIGRLDRVADFYSLSIHGERRNNDPPPKGDFEAVEKIKINPVKKRKK